MSTHTDPTQGDFLLKSRRTDPSTSKQAGAAHSGDRLRTSQARVLAVLRLYGPLTDKELVERVQDTERDMGFEKVMSPSGIRSRRAELVRLEKVRDSGTTKNLDGYNCTVWEVTP